jgi:hypothetical protein
MDNQLVEDIKSSRAELDKRGWCKGDLVNEQGNVCALGAIGCALLDDFAYHATVGHLPYNALENSQRARAVIIEVAKHGTLSRSGGEIARVYEINDTASSVDEVKLFFDKALADLGGLA